MGSWRYWQPTVCFYIIYFTNVFSTNGKYIFSLFSHSRLYYKHIHSNKNVHHRSYSVHINTPNCHVSYPFPHTCNTSTYGRDAAANVDSVH